MVQICVSRLEGLLASTCISLRFYLDRGETAIDVLLAGSARMKSNADGEISTRRRQ